MKKKLFYSSVLIAAAFGSCVSEEPFSKDGEGTLRMKMVVSGELTRAEAESDLASNCKILISKAEKGLLYKYEGVNSVPDRIVLSSGSYVAEGYAGDSVSASWDKKFYKGRREFQIQSGYDTQVELVCGIANVVAAIDSETLDPKLIKNWKLTVGHSRGELEFTQDNIDDKAYFMMPSADWNAADGSDVGSLNWKITGTDGNGIAFEPVSGILEHVKPAHQYNFNINLGSADLTQGGGFIEVSVDTICLEPREDLVLIFGAPAIASATEGISIDSPLTFAPGDFSKEALEIGVKSHIGLSALKVAFSPVDKFGVDHTEYNLLYDEALMSLENIGFKVKEPIIKTEGGEDYETRYISISRDMLNRLERGTYSITLSATDIGRADDTGKLIQKTTEKVIEFLVDDAKVLVNEEPLKVRSYSAQMAINVVDGTVRNPGVRYRKKGSQDDWTEVVAQGKVVTLSSLNPATTYEVQAIADDSEGKYVNGVSVDLTTEGIFTIPNASFEDWSLYTENTKVMLPGPGGKVTFWDSGNHGSATMSKTLTEGSTDMKHSGENSAKLSSKFVGIGTIGKFAAGNLFVGKYVDTDGTDGILEFGQEYDGSHPVALTLWANYRPKEVIKSGASSEGLPQGAIDKGQIYVALATDPVEIRTKSSNRKLLDPNGAEIVAYGEVTWDSDFGAEGQLEKVTIPLDYRETAKNKSPKYLIIVCSASKYGDFFSGGEGSVMYVDDMELLYE